MREEKQTYTDIGHNSSSMLWVWKDGSFKTAPSIKYGSHGEWWHQTRAPEIFRADYVGRYDPHLKIISIGKPGFGPPIKLTSVPKELIQSLKFEFGDNNKIKAFEGKSAPVVDPVNFTPIT